MKSEFQSLSKNQITASEASPLPFVSASQSKAQADLKRLLFADSLCKLIAEFY